MSKPATANRRPGIRTFTLLLPEDLYQRLYVRASQVDRRPGNYVRTLIAAALAKKTPAGK